MKRFLVFILISLVSLSLFDLSCAPSPKTSLGTARVDTPTVVQGKEDLFQAGRFFFGGQSDEDMLQWLSAEGTTVVINLRTDKEMEDHSKEKFDEAALVKELGMTYLHFPLGGDTGYSPQAVDTLAQTLEEYSGKTFIHCRSAGRVSYLWVAYLIKYKGLTIDDAVYIGKKIKFSFLLEDLLGYPITMRRMK